MSIVMGNRKFKLGILTHPTFWLLISGFENGHKFNNVNI